MPATNSIRTLNLSNLEIRGLFSAYPTLPLIPLPLHATGFALQFSSCTNSTTCPLVLLALREIGFVL